MWTVTLLRGKNQPRQTWSHKDEAHAMQRANALRYIHDAKLEISWDQQDVTVDASERYL